MTSTQDNGLVHLKSIHSVEEVLKRLRTLLETKGVKLFAVIDHSGEAHKIGIEMHATKVAIFGNPKAGTPLMISAPDCALDLPLKLLIAESPDGTTRITYNSTQYLQSRYSLEPNMAANIAVIDQIASAITQ